MAVNAGQYEEESGSNREAVPQKKRHTENMKGYNSKQLTRIKMLLML